MAVFDEEAKAKNLVYQSITRSLRILAPAAGLEPATL
jgi:hypothetical protein